MHSSRENEVKIIIKQNSYIAYEVSRCENSYEESLS